MSSTSSAFRPAVAVAVYGLLLVGFAGWSWSTQLADFGGDNAVYWLTANHFSPWGTTHPTAAHFAAKSVFPPLFPVLLAMTGGGASLLGAHLVSALLLWFGLLAFGHLLLRMGFGPLAALGLVVGFASTRTTLYEALQIHSEHLYLALTMLALGFALSASSRRNALYLCAGCVAAAYLTRTSGVALAAATIIFVALRHRRHMPGFLAIVGLPIVAWSLFHHGSSSYVGEMIRLYEQGGFTDMLERNVRFLWFAWRACFGEPGLPAMSPLPPAAFALLGLAGLGVRLRTVEPDALYVAAYLSMLVLWPYPAEYQRMLYPILPLVLALGLFFAVIWLPAHIGRVLPAHGCGLFFAVLAAAVLPFAGHALMRFQETPADPGFAPYTRTLAWYMADPRQALLNVGYHRAVTEALLDIRANDRVAHDECVLAIKTSVVSLYSERLARGMPRPDAAGVIDRAQYRANRCRTLFMTQAASPTFPYTFFPYEQLKDELVELRVYANAVNPEIPAALLGRLPSATHP